MTTFLTDNFTGTNGDALNGRTASGGGTWTLFNGSDGLIYSNLARGNASTYAYYAHSVTAGADGEYVEAAMDGTYRGTTVAGVIVRYVSGSGNSFYMARINCSTNKIEIWRQKNGSLQSLKATTSFTASGNHTLRLTATGTGASVVLDVSIDSGAASDSHTDSHADRLTTLGKAGFTFGSAGGDTSGWRFDSITAVDPTSAAASLILPRAGWRQQHLLVR